LEELDQRKYTFGKIELDPISACQQYSRAAEKEAVPAGKGGRHRGSIQLSSFEDKYSKYVKNRQVRSRFYSKDISAILEPTDSNLTSKRDFLAREYLPDSIKESETNIQRRQDREKERGREKDSGLTYDKLRELLWA
jgi:hypothetical protein